ncbi:hypothetical protein BaRGS_00035999 [Batillaria attramentaria]|uniref:Uncharacterized protein n=1 Tax=Batillaria attramentaria TaxID=370345 RepID=A0ABD0JD03_9CAEN
MALLPRLVLLLTLCVSVFGGVLPDRGQARYESDHLSRGTQVKQDPVRYVPFELVLDEGGGYSLRQGNKTWLQSAPMFLYMYGERFDQGDMKPSGPVRDAGSDKFGEWNATCYEYMAGAKTFRTCVKQWTDPTWNMVIFQQQFISGSSGSAQDKDSVISGFPSFQVPDEDVGLGYQGYQGSMFGSNGVSGRSLDKFDRVSWGVMGGVDSVPMGFEYQTVLYYGYFGINQEFSAWGDRMKAFYDKGDYYRKTDQTINYLGYWTDGGAYYYYDTEPGKNYEQTILDVKTYADSLSLPYRYVQYDSWFYAKDSHGAVTTWTPTPDIAPDGFQYGYPPLVVSSKTPYAKQNGGGFNFIVESEKAIPQDLNFWLWLFKESRTWGLTVYEQDWLDVEFAGLNARCRQWMWRGLGCSRWGRQHVQRVSPSSTARVSGDYRAGSDQWQIGKASVFADAMGIAPFKDNFWTTEVQPGNRYKLNETHPELQAAVAVLSTGPVAPSDMIGRTNVSMLMQCCRADGLVLRPAKPATAIDKQFWQDAFGGNVGSKGQVWTTYSRIGKDYVFGIILAADMTDDFSITPSDAGFAPFGPMVAISRSAYGEAPKVIPFSEDSPVPLTTDCTRPRFCMYYTSPVFNFSNSQVVLYGEENKFVPMSRDRVGNMAVFSNDLQLLLYGSPGESTVFTFFLDGKINRVTCKFETSGTVTLSVFYKMCSTST